MTTITVHPNEPQSSPHGQELVVNVRARLASCDCKTASISPRGAGRSIRTRPLAPHTSAHADLLLAELQSVMCRSSSAKNPASIEPALMSRAVDSYPGL